MGQDPFLEESKRWGILSLSSYIRKGNRESKKGRLLVLMSISQVLNSPQRKPGEYVCEVSFQVSLIEGERYICTGGSTIPRGNEKCKQADHQHSPVSLLSQCGDNMTAALPLHIPSYADNGLKL